MSDLLFRNVRIASEEAAVTESQDVLIQEGVIQRIGQNLVAPEGVKVVEGAGRLLMPAMFDTHVHFREPGGEHKETIQSGSEAAINGGITGVVMMPNTTPAIDSGAVVKQVLAKAKEVSRIPVLTSGCITKGREGKELAAMSGMRDQGVVMITDDGDAVPESSTLLRAMQYAENFDCFFASHCEVEDLAGPRAMNEGAMSYKLGIQGSPAIAEEICLDRDIRIAHAAGAHVHIQHVSSALGMETIRWWKTMGAKVTAEVSPHHLLFCDEDIGDYDTHYKMNPPLRTKKDNELLLQGFKEGVFDILATDHAPHAEFEKQQDFVNAPNGITGLETALISMYHYFVKEEKLTWQDLVLRYSAEPRRMMRLAPVPISEGARVDLLLFNEEGETTFTKDYMKSLSSNTPFLDKTLTGSIDMVVLGDRVLLERNI